MDAIQFTAVVGPDGLIHPPEGVSLPAGEVEVSVRSRHGRAELDDAPQGHPHQWLLDLVQEIERSGPHDLPPDMAENHDHYAHGAPKR